MECSAGGTNDYIGTVSVVSTGICVVFCVVDVKYSSTRHITLCCPCTVLALSGYVYGKDNSNM